MKTELLARLLVVLLLAAAVGTPLAARFSQISSAAGGVVEIRATRPENGGWSPDVIHAVAGQPLHLKLTSDDTIHGFAVGQTDWPAIDIQPGQVVETDLLFQRPGKYTFFCTRWCGPNHWRMRGTIEVTEPIQGGSQASAPTVEPPLFQRLGVNIDALPQLDPAVERSLAGLKELPSAWRGSALKDILPPELRQPDWLRTHTPADAFLLLRNDKTHAALNDGQLWDAVAYAWRASISQDTLAQSAKLYARDCAACHGEAGRGDGPAGRDLPGLVAMKPISSMTGANMPGMSMPGITMPVSPTADLKKGPADFTNIHRLAGLSDVVLQGKLLRGGMGTGMPEFGSLYTTDQQWALIAYIQGFALLDNGH